MPSPTACVIGYMERCINRWTSQKLQEKLGRACRRLLPKSERSGGVCSGWHKGCVGLQPSDATRPKIDRLARMPKLGARVLCCVDDIGECGRPVGGRSRDRAQKLSAWSKSMCGAGRCGVTTTPDRCRDRQVDRRGPRPEIRGHPGLSGRDAAPDSYEDRKDKIDIAVVIMVREDAVDTLKADGIDCDIVGGGGTGSYYFESNSGVYNELAVRLLRFHGCRLWPHPGQGRQAD